MEKPIIEVRDLSKLYRLGSIGTADLRDSVGAWWGRVRGKTDAAPAKRSARFLRDQAGPVPNSFWALRDVSFTIQPGEVVGVLGHNGAGKSTLLKVLARITEPTSGRAILRGRVASLLEVGTGFHPDLTGRENIFLNGAILGMKHAEITRKFDEIVAFAEVEDFIDTPVKRYSSGMQLRLAFAVAAHLEPEILLVDEVLAVGDSSFQKKCLGKMGDVAKQGRTVLVVSHNMASILSLCSRALLMRTGRLAKAGPVKPIVEEYLDDATPREEIALDSRTDRDGDGSAQFQSISVESEDSGATIRTMSRLKITLRYKSPRPLRHARFVAWVHDQTGVRIFEFDSVATGGLPDELPSEGTLACVTEPINLTPGRCYVNIDLQRGTQVADHVEHAAHFDVEADDFYGTGKIPPREWAMSLLAHKWTCV